MKSIYTYPKEIQDKLDKIDSRISEILKYMKNKIEPYLSLDEAVSALYKTKTKKYVLSCFRFYTYLWD